MKYKLKDNNIIFETDTLSVNFMRAIKSRLRKTNSEYKFAQHRSYYIPQFLYYYKQSKDKSKTTININSLFLFSDVLSESFIKKIYSENNKIKHSKISKQVKANNLYNYQLQAVDKIKNKINNENVGGVVVAPPGSGKTEILVETVKELRLKTLIVAHTKDLTTQIKQRFEKYYNFNILELTSQNKSKVSSCEIAVVTIQTLRNIVNDINNAFDLIIFDEVHHYASKSYKGETVTKKAIDKINAIRLGFTATNYRSDEEKTESGFTISVVMNDVIAEINKEDCTQNIQKTEHLEVINSDFSLRDLIKDKSNLNTDGTLNYSKLLNALAKDQKRNDLIIKSVKENVKKERKVIILTERVEHLNLLNIELSMKENIKSVVFDSKLKKKEREEVLEKARNDEFEVIIATYKIFSEGVDLTNFDTILLALPRKFEGSLTQALGRVERKNEKKKESKIIDVVDKNIQVLHKQHLERMRFYKKNNIK